MWPIIMSKYGGHVCVRSFDTNSSVRCCCSCNFVLFLMVLVAAVNISAWYICWLYELFYYNAEFRDIVVDNISIEILLNIFGILDVSVLNVEFKFKFIKWLKNMLGGNWKKRTKKAKKKDFCEKQ